MKTRGIFEYLFGTSQIESELDATREHIEQILEAAEKEEPLKTKKTPLASALKSLDVQAGEALEFGPEGFSLRYDDDDVYRDACIKLCEPEGMEKLADLGWVALRSGDRAMSNEPPEYRIRFVDITTADTTDADKPSQTLANVIKAGREFVQQEPEQDKDNPVEHPDAPNKQQAGVGDAKDGKDPEGKPKGSGKNESNEYQPKTGKRCTCKPGVHRDNCPECEGTGWKIDFAKIRSRRNRNVSDKGPEGTPKDEAQQIADNLLNSVNENDDDIGDDEPQENPECPQCGGPGTPLGSLGKRKHFRCRNCGWDFGLDEAYDPNDPAGGFYRELQRDQKYRKLIKSGAIRRIHAVKRKCEKCGKPVDPGTSTTLCPACHEKSLTQAEKDLNVESLVEGAHKAGCSCGWCQNKGRFGKKKKEGDEPAAAKDADSDPEPKSEPKSEKPDTGTGTGEVEHTFDSQEEHLRYDDVLENIARLRGRPKNVKDTPVAKKPAGGGKVCKAYKTARKMKESEESSDNAEGGYHYSVFKEGARWAAQVLRGPDEEVVRYKTFDTQQGARSKLEEWKKKFGQ